MRSSLVSVVVLAVMMVVPAAAQPASDAQATTPKPAETPRAAQAVQPDGPSPGIPSRSNIQLELTITDQTGSGPVEKKTVSMIAASGTWGKVRTQGMTRPNERDGWQSINLNVDARPFTFPGGIVQVELTINYNPPGNQPASLTARPTELNQSLTVVLQSGKPLVVSQAADPITDRKILVEVKATILK